jgi:hypothetical protein
MEPGIAKIVVEQGKYLIKEIIDSVRHVLHGVLVTVGDVMEVGNFNCLKLM